nr:protein mesh-like [Lytechinus pictus]
MAIMIVGRRKNSFCTRLLLILCLAWIANSELYPFGTGNGDTALRKENDFAERVTLDRAFPFGGKYHNVLYIGDNGVISFEDAIYVESTVPKNRNLPIYYDADEDGVVEDPDGIFPFWADVDISSDGGNIYYRVSTTTSTLDQATTDVRNYFRSNVNFQAQVVIVVTWDQVSFYNQAGDQDPRNTFQAVLIHDGQESFVFLNYETINWVVGTLMQGDQNTGLFGSSKIGIAIVGFLMSDGEISEVFNYDQDTLRELPTDSNVDVDGVYAYKVDSSSIIDPVCKTGPGAELSITPARCGMMGGERIYLYGPCWAVERVQTCVFSHGGDIIQEVNATVLNTNEAYCVPDPFFLVGEVTIAVVKAGDELASSPSTIYSLLESGRITPTITRRDTDSFNWDVADNSLTITWEPDQESFGTSDSALSINVLAYREDSPGPRWETVYLITNSTADDGSHTFTPTAQPEVTEDNAFGVIRITGNANGRERVLWSDIHPLGYLMEQSYQEDPVLWATDKCNDWLTADDAKGPFIEHGFRKKRSCTSQLLHAVQDLSKGIDAGDQLGVILLDLSKAFDKVPHAKYLGVNFEENLKWNHHVDKTTKSANSVSSFLQRNIRDCPLKTKVLCYKALVLPVLEYADVVWDPFTQRNISKLEMVQRRYARFALGDFRRTSSVSDMLKQLQWATLQERRAQQRASMVYGIINKLIDIPDDQFIPSTGPCTRGNPDKFQIPYARTQIYQKTFFTDAIRMWNSLPAKIVHSTSLASFKQEVQQRRLR